MGKPMNNFALYATRCYYCAVELLGITSVVLGLTRPDAVGEGIPNIVLGAGAYMVSRELSRMLTKENELEAKSAQSP